MLAKRSRLQLSPRWPFDYCGRRVFGVSRLLSGLSTDENAEIEQANAKYAGRIILQESSIGWGVYAERDYAPDSYIFTGQALETTYKRTAHSIQISKTQHIHMDLPARFLNHACGSFANIGMRLQKNGYDIVAKKPIQSGDQLRFDYETTEYEIGAPFPCSCGAPDCRGMLQGYRWNSAQVRAVHGDDWIAPYLMEERQD